MPTELHAHKSGRIDFRAFRRSSENCEIDYDRFENDFAFTCVAGGCKDQIATNEKTGALAFVAQFSPIGFVL